MKQPKNDESLLNALIAAAPFNGFSDAALESAAEDVFGNKSEAYVVYPRGIEDAVDHFASLTDAKMRLFVEKNRIFPTLKIRQKIATLVMFRIETHQPKKEAMRRLMAYYASPQHAAQASRHLCETVDVMWRLAGDKATDYNYYTKRGLLAGVYSATLLAWLTDNTDDLHVTREFLDRRIENVMGIEKLKKTVIDFASRVPDFLKVRRFG